METPSTRTARRGSGRIRAAVRRAIMTLPSPRDEAALEAARHVKAIVTGTLPRPVQAKKTARAKKAPIIRPGGDGIRGRWLRPVNTPAGAESVTDREVSDPTEAAAVRAGWLLIDAHERLSIRGAERVFGHELAAWHAYAHETVAPLEHPTDGGSMEIKEGKNNVLRYRRTMDFAQEGDRVFDVGFGQGYLAAQLIRERGVKSYHGIDILVDNKPVAEALFEANGLAGTAIELEYGNLFDLTQDRVVSAGASLVICCEVLEHVDDAELALRTLAEALPDGTDLVFSVPLHGRLEGVWGHLSVFDVARLKEMLDGAGLFAHHVEPLSNTWSLIVASRSPEPSERVRKAPGRPPLRSSVALSQHRAFVDVDTANMVATGGSMVNPKIKGMAMCRLAKDGGVSFPVAGLEAIRLRLEFTDIEHIDRFIVTAWANGVKAGIWVWEPEARQITGSGRRFALRPGETLGTFKSGYHRDLDKADRVDVVAVVEPGRSAEFGCRAAYLP